jgi:tRNA(Met) C34 N-acetyltransferase TmcA
MKNLYITCPFDAELDFLSRVLSCQQDVHERFRTESHTQAAARFNERFLLSIASCKACVVMDDELNILPISSHMKFIQPVTNNEVWVLNSISFIGMLSIPFPP